jgi:hypothetical protein
MDLSITLLFQAVVVGAIAFGVVGHIVKPLLRWSMRRRRSQGGVKITPKEAERLSWYVRSLAFLVGLVLGCIPAWPGVDLVGARVWKPVGILAGALGGVFAPTAYHVLKKALPEAVLRVVGGGDVQGPAGLQGPVEPPSEAGPGA